MHIVHDVLCCWREFNGKPLPRISWRSSTLLCLLPIVVKGALIKCRLRKTWMNRNFRIECEPSSWCFVRGRRLISRWRMDPGHGVAAGADGAVAQPGKGGILYCVVARGATVLARLSLVKILQVICAIYGTPPLVLHFTLWITGMLRVLETLRKSVTWCWQRLVWVWVSRWTKINPFPSCKVREQEQPKMTLTQGEFLFHYVSSDGVVALAIAGLQTVIERILTVNCICLSQTPPMTEGRHSSSWGVCWTSSWGNLGKEFTQRLPLPWTRSSALSLRGNQQTNSAKVIIFFPVKSRDSARKAPILPQWGTLIR